jgi:excisionase family DNA binding protein
MSPGKANLLTTGQAAALCSVTPDTILKWIKRGRLNGVRTAGGHYRIDGKALEPFIEGPHDDARVRVAEELRGRAGGRLRCWEYLSDQGEVREACRDCVVYRVRADRCFLMADLEHEVGHVRQFCQTSCEDCAYYRHVKGLAPRVLVITADEELIDRLSDEQDNGIALRGARNGYEASAVIPDFRPSFAVIDAACVPTGSTELLDALAGDPRVPGLRVIVAALPGRATRRRGWMKNKMIISVLEKPFGCRQVAEVVKDALTALPAPEGSAQDNATRKVQR